MEAVFVPVKLDEGFDFSLFLEDLSFELPLNLMLLRMRQQHPVVVRALKPALEPERAAVGGRRTAGTLVVFRPLPATPWVEAELARREAERAAGRRRGRGAPRPTPTRASRAAFNDLDDAAAVVARLLSAMERIDELERVAGGLPAQLDEARRESARDAEPLRGDGAARGSVARADRARPPRGRAPAGAATSGPRPSPAAAEAAAARGPRPDVSTGWSARAPRADARLGHRRSRPPRLARSRRCRVSAAGRTWPPSWRRCAPSALTRRRRSASSPRCTRELAALTTRPASSAAPAAAGDSCRDCREAVVPGDEAAAARHAAARHEDVPSGMVAALRETVSAPRGRRPADARRGLGTAASSRRSRRA